MTGKRFHRITPPSGQHLNPRIGDQPSVVSDPDFLPIVDGLERGYSHVEGR
jgi:hypothetical protein